MQKSGDTKGAGYYTPKTKQNVNYDAERVLREHRRKNKDKNVYPDDTYNIDAVLQAERKRPSVADIIKNTLDEIVDLELDEKRLKQAAERNKAELAEARKVEQWLKILELAKTDESISEDVDQLITMYNLKINHGDK